MKKIGAFFNSLGKALQLPVAVLPAAGLMVGLGLMLIGDPLFSGVPTTIWQAIGQFLTNCGTSVFGVMPLVFALGLAIGFAKDHHGSAVLAAFVGHTILLAGIATLNPDIKLGVFSGIFMGPIAGVLYNKFNAVKLPAALAFFGGKRFVPIVTGAVSMVMAVILAFIWAPFQAGINAVGNAIINGGLVGYFGYGFLNRLLVPVGLHQILNALVWFDLGEFTNAAGEVVRGDLWRYWAGDKTAGVYMVGFFPIMMFGLPAACAAMVVMAKKHKRAAIAGLLGSMAFTSFLTGITEPVEFSFMFLAFPLYVVHAVLTGISHVIANLLQARLGFTFSAGAIDYVLSYNLGSHQIAVLVLGLAYAVVYFFLFVAVIKIFNLKTPGREDDDDDSIMASTSKKDNEAYTDQAMAIMKALGGNNNIEHIDACATRLRVEVKDDNQIDEATLKKLGAKGVIKAKGNVQVIIGTEANDLADTMNSLLH